MKTDTCSHFLTVAHLANLIDWERGFDGGVEECLLGLFIGCYRLFLASFGIVRTLARNYEALCLLGVGAIDLLDCPNKEHLLGGEPQPRYW